MSLCIFLYILYKCFALPVTSASICCFFSSILISSIIFLLYSFYNNNEGDPLGTTINAIKGAPTSAEIEEANRQIQEAQDFVDQVKGHRGTMREGMEAQGMQDTLTSANEIERAVLDKTDWGLGTRAYRTADNAGHSYYTTFYDSTKQAYENIINAHNAVL